MNKIKKFAKPLSFALLLNFMFFLSAQSAFAFGQYGNNPYNTVGVEEDVEIAALPAIGVVAVAGVVGFAFGAGIADGMNGGDQPAEQQELIAASERQTYNSSDFSSFDY